MFRTRSELHQFVAGLRIPDSRRALVEGELHDHLESRIAIELARGADAASAEHTALVALGDPDQLRRSLEQIEPAFEISPRSALVKGFASAIGSAILFAVVGVLFPRGPGIVENLIVAVPVVSCALCLMWIIGPRGISTAIRAEARSSSRSASRSSVTRRAVKGYLGAFVALFLAVWGSSLAGMPDSIVHGILWPFGLLGIVYGSYVLHVMHDARRERAHA
jgi:hypothetical protein